MDTMLWVCAGIALVSAILGAIFLPRRTQWAAEPAAAAGVPAEPGVVEVPVGQVERRA
jgi:hypothetical protein